MDFQKKIMEIFWRPEAKVANVYKYKSKLKDIQDLLRTQNVDEKRVYDELGGNSLRADVSVPAAIFAFLKCSKPFKNFEVSVYCFLIVCNLLILMKFYRGKIRWFGPWRTQYALVVIRIPWEQWLAPLRARTMEVCMFQKFGT